MKKHYIYYDYIQALLNLKLQICKEMAITDNPRNETYASKKILSDIKVLVTSSTLTCLLAEFHLLPLQLPTARILQPQNVPNQTSQAHHCLDPK